LGLALTKRIVESQGGRVGVRSTYGHGSVFYAVLPRVARPVREGDGEPMDTAPAPGPAGGPRILVIEDDPNDRRWLTDALTCAGGRAGPSVGAAHPRRGRQPEGPEARREGPQPPGLPDRHQRGCEGRAGGGRAGGAGGGRPRPADARDGWVRIPATAAHASGP